MGRQKNVQNPSQIEQKQNCKDDAGNSRNCNSSRLSLDEQIFDKYWIPKHGPNSLINLIIIY